MKGLQVQFNVAQFVQAENVPFSLNSLMDIDTDGIKFLTIEALYDIAGAVAIDSSCFKRSDLTGIPGKNIVIISIGATLLHQ